MDPFRKIAVAIDFDGSSEQAIQRATDLARRYAAELIVVHAVEVLVNAFPLAIALAPAAEHGFAAAQQGLLSVVQRVQTTLPGARSMLVRGNAAEQILTFVVENAVDLVVLGTHGRTGPSRWVLGSVAEKIVRSCPVEVLIVRATTPPK